MARPKIEINPERGKRLKILLKETNTKQTELAEKIHLSQQTVSQIINGKANLTPETAELIANSFPPYSEQWLLCNWPPQMKTDDDMISALQETVSLGYQLAIDIKEKQHLAIKNLINCLEGYSVDCDTDTITVQISGSSAKVKLTASEASEYCDELSAMVKAFVNFHFFQHRRIKQIKIVDKD